MSRTCARLRPWSEHGHNGPYRTKENMMAKYLLLKHYRGAPAAVNDVPMDQWTPEEFSAHIQYMRDFANRLEGTGELSAAPGAGGKPIHEWLELRPFYGVSPTITE